jgi:hypothetical protein
MTEPTDPPPSPYAAALIRLLQGVVYTDDQEVWSQILRHAAEIRAYCGVIGLSLYVSDADGYAFLRQDAREDEEALPRLVRRVPLTYHATLLCVLLRERLMQHDAGNIDSPRLVVSRDDVIEAMRPFFREQSDETRFVKQVDAAINRVRELGFLTPLKGDDPVFEVRPILKAQLTPERLTEIREVLHAHAADA